MTCLFIYWFIYLGFYVTFQTIQVISQRVEGRAEENNTYSSSGLCTVNCRPTASNYHISNKVYPECAGYGNVPITQINWLMPIGWIAPIFHIHHFSLNFLCLESGLWYFREHHSSTENFMSLTEWPFSVKCLETGVILFSLGWFTECLCSYILSLNSLE